MGRVSVLNGIGSIFIFIGKIFIVCATVMVSYIVLTRYSYYKLNITNPILPCIVSSSFRIFDNFKGPWFRNCTLADNCAQRQHNKI